MKVLMLTLGTRGDVQPFVALGAEFSVRGHEAVLAAPERFAAQAADYDVPFATIDDGPLALMDASKGVGEVADGGIRARAKLARAMPASFRRVLDDCWQIASTGPGAGADLIVHNGQVLAGQHIAEKLGMPAVLAQMLPMFVPTREFPWPGQALPEWLPAWLNRATFLGMKAPAAMFGGAIDRWRSTLGLPRRRGRHNPLLQPDGTEAPVLNATSRHVVPHPRDWPDQVHTSGYWTLPQPAEPAGLPAELEDFLTAGEPPVLVTFGSMAGSDPARTTGIVAGAIAKAGVRAVLVTAWGGLTVDGLESKAKDRLMAVEQVPYELLLPRTVAVVHHGGAGTVGAATAGGRPQVVCPFVADQPFWGRRLHQLGVATRPIPQRALTREDLAAAIDTAISDPRMRARAAELGELVRAEHGTASAVSHLETLVSNRSQRGA